ncbi:MAG TPA: hypothetical protein ENF81_06615 [Thermotogaceae bacterium]|nr:hypothetical protein [Thermotogaceae bacterium]
MAALLTMFGFVPQVIKIFCTKSVEDVSLPMLFQFGIGVLLWTLYGFHLRNPIHVVANIVTFLTLSVVIGLYIHYSYVIVGRNNER